MGGSPQPERNLFGMPNLFSNFGVGGSPAVAAAPQTGGGSAGSGGGTNLFGNMFGGGGNLFGGGASQQQQQQPPAFASQQPGAFQPAGGAFSSQAALGFASGFASQQPQGGFGSQVGAFSN